MSDEAKSYEFDPRLLLAVLKEKGVTQAKLSRLCGFAHKNTVNKIIKGKRVATASELIRFCEALNAHPADFARKN